VAAAKPAIHGSRHSEDPGVEPVAAADGGVDLGVAPLDERPDLVRLGAGRRRAAVEVVDRRQPARQRHRPRLQQHATQKAVDGAGVQRLQRRGQAIEQRLQPGDVVVGQGVHEAARVAKPRWSQTWGPDGGEGAASCGRIMATSN
jgi:hypothetical protein